MIHPPNQRVEGGQPLPHSLCKLTKASEVKAKAPRGTRKPLRIPTPEKMEQLLRAIQATRAFIVWASGVVTGTRLGGETLGLTWDAID